MIKLVIDTCSTDLIMSIVTNDCIVDSKIINQNKNHSNNFLLELKKLLDDNNFTLEDVSLVAITNGPGSFTGVRISLVFAKIFAYLKNVEVKAISKLRFNISGYEKYDYYGSMIKDKNNNVYAGIYDENYDTLYEKLVNIDEFLHIFSSYSGEKCIIIDTDYDKYAFSKPKFNFLKVTNFKSNNEGKSIHTLNPNYLKLTQAQEKLNVKN
ncbi:MAG: tRNA (adenosine(37)-N6)-threonylcarbamoyltransferase complex dimerization subunit type 1 TsaB [Bacilli bacterium]